MPSKKIYTGVVVDNEDPEKRGRLNIECPQVVSGDIMDWVEPTFFFVDSANNAGAFFIPGVGSEVEIEIEDEEDSQTNGLEAKWRCALYPYGTVPEEFQENYPKRSGWKTAAGHVFYFDDTENAMTFQYTHPSGTEIKVDNNGNVFINSSETIYVGTDADEQLVRGNKLETYISTGLTSIRNIFNKHTHTETGTITTSPDTGYNIPAMPSDVLSDHKVK